MGTYRIAVVLLLTSIPRLAAAQPSQVLPPQDEASCLSGLRMTDTRRAYIDEWLRIDRFRTPPSIGESESDWAARSRTTLACGRRNDWLQQDQEENWRRQVIALPEERQRQLWSELAAESERRRSNPPAPDSSGRQPPTAITTVWQSLQTRWRDEDAAKAAAKAAAAPPAQPAPPQRVGVCVQRDDQGRDRCMAPVWYVMNDRGCQQVDTLIGDAQNRIRTPLDFKSSARQEGVEVTLQNVAGPGQMVEATVVGSSSMLVFVPNFLSCSGNFNVLMRQAKSLPAIDLAPQPPPAWVAALGAP